MKICGCDPGCSGALALLDDGGNIIDLVDMPTVKVRSGKTAKARMACAELVRILREWKPDLVMIELVGGMPGQGAASSFQFGYADGPGIDERRAKILALRAQGLSNALIAERTGWSKSLVSHTISQAKLVAGVTKKQA